MTLDQIKIKIAERVDDPSGTGYAERYEGLFISAMCEVIKAIDKNGIALFSPSEYPELTEPYEDSISFKDGFAEIPYSDIGDIIFIRDVYSNPITISLANRINFQPRTTKELLFIRSNPHLTPDSCEGYWSEKGKSVYLLVYRGVTKTGSSIISFDIVKNPIPAEWGSQDLITALHYGAGFIWASIKRAAEILRSEIGLE